MQLTLTKPLLSEMLFVSFNLWKETTWKFLMKLSCFTFWPITTITFRICMQCIITITIITFCIQCSPVAGLSGWMYIRFGISGSAFPATIHWLQIQFKIF